MNFDGRIVTIVRQFTYRVALGHPLLGRISALYAQTFLRDYFRTRRKSRLLAVGKQLRRTLLGDHKPEGLPQILQCLHVGQSPDFVNRLDSESKKIIPV